MKDFVIQGEELHVIECTTQIREVPAADGSNKKQCVTTVVWEKLPVKIFTIPEPEKKD